jgi:3-oxoacyl-(acyl-carrier-protein) synthase
VTARPALAPAPVQSISGQNASGQTVVVSGLGLVTPAGIGVEANWSRVCSGEPTAAADPELAGLPVDFCCRVPDFDPRLHVGGRQSWRLDRYSQFAVAAAREALADARLDTTVWDGARVAVVLGTAAGGIGSFERQHRRFLDGGYPMISPLLLPAYLPNMAAGLLAITFGATGPNLTVATACASGAGAVGTALALLRAGLCDLALAGGAEAMVTRFAAAAYAKTGALSRRHEDVRGASRPFDADRDGFVLGEGAGVLLLERERDALARNVAPRAVLAGYGASADGYDQVAPHPEGAGAQSALRTALADAGAGPEEVDHVNAHGTGTRLNDRIEAAALRRVLGAGAAVTSTKGVTGHTLGAAGAIEAAFTVLAVEHGIVPPCANLDRLDPQIDLDVVAGAPRKVGIELALSDSFGFGGNNAVLAFRPHSRQRDRIDP